MSFGRAQRLSSATTRLRPTREQGQKSSEPQHANGNTRRHLRNPESAQLRHPAQPEHQQPEHAPSTTPEHRRSPNIRHLTSHGQTARPKERQRMILTTSGPRNAARVRRSPTRECADARTGVRSRPVARASFEARCSREPVVAAPQGGIREYVRSVLGVSSRRGCTPRRRCTLRSRRALLRDSTVFLGASRSARSAVSCAVTTGGASRLARSLPVHERRAHAGSSVAPRAAGPSFGS